MMEVEDILREIHKFADGADVEEFEIKEFPNTNKVFDRGLASHEMRSCVQIKISLITKPFEKPQFNSINRSGPVVIPLGRH
jgi:hypothetical protein